MIKNLEETLLKRAKFYSDCTNASGGISEFQDFVRNTLGDGPLSVLDNTHNSKLYKGAILEDLILEDKTDSFSGGIMSINDMRKQGMQFNPDTVKPNQIDHMKIYELFKNVPIQESKDMRKFKDMPKSFREYYKGAKLDKDGYFDISDHCYYRFVEGK